MIGVIGAGAFGTALSAALSADGTPVCLWAREGGDAINEARENRARLPGCTLPPALLATSDLQRLQTASHILLVVPAQQTERFLNDHAADLPSVPLVLCAKGITKSGFQLQSELTPKGAKTAVLTGPGFASDIAQGLPTALTLASRGQDLTELQKTLSRPNLRLYRTDDVVGAQLGGALKNVIAIAAGIAIGAGLGESARAAIVTRGFAEMRTLAATCGAQDHTLSGLSGLGDLMLTCASAKSRNFRHGLALGGNQSAPIETVEGVATAQATLDLAASKGVEMPITQAVSAVLSQSSSVSQALEDLLSRPLRSE